MVDGDPRKSLFEAFGEPAVPAGVPGQQSEPPLLPGGRDGVFPLLLPGRLRARGEIIRPRSNFPMSELQPPQPSSMTVQSSKPLIGVIVRNDESEMVHYTTEENELDQVSSARSIQRALDLAGAWSDLDWDE